MHEPDRLLATQTMNALIELQKTERQLDAQELRALARRIQPTTSAAFSSLARSDRTRVDAWLTICDLTQIVQSYPKSQDVRTRLEYAIAQVQLWQTTLG